ncbi:endolytic transglycosylase MltG [Maritimibacter sp. UBA3975]|uniref:endolytic transglycosylase MltG n=1 Tax=Maritimibacter sp. UBA3975 TaxID=1946833 RepID=UPI000C09C868|nr:endolytic transglycosylase MltG [Maritimibacter sp. UBA3975]MAM60198.1 branched-chain alpha-keto acid dehydrogenase subunit E2 [Maritimibacter sp.]|tara:strand:+ start:9360 stop:10514 length:1155 start_codon:yes stop_codon:yes gene_type:complete
MWRNIASNTLSLMIVALVVVGGVIGWGQRQYVAQGPLETAICLKVEPGSNFNRVSDALEAQGAITSPSIFRMGAEYSGKSTQLKAGSFLVDENASMEEIVDVVTRGGASTCGTEVIYRIGINSAEYQVRELDPATQSFVTVAEFAPDAEVPADYTRVRDQADTRYRIAIAEGTTSWQIVNALRQVEFLDGELAEVPAEGSLAPDSYEMRPDDARAELIARMEDAQDARLATAWENRAEGLPYDSPEEALIMASIVEKETGVAEERRQVASVFVNRLEQGMRLQTDPTVIYGITNGQGVLGRGIRQSELRAETPYNTYVIAGLPPTPIANPGLAAIEAAVHPDSTDYLFFVADGTGGHAFATTLEDHNRNVARWREIEAERAANQ